MSINNKRYGTPPPSPAPFLRGRRADGWLSSADRLPRRRRLAKSSPVTSLCRPASPLEKPQEGARIRRYSL